MTVFIFTLVLSILAFISSKDYGKNIPSKVYWFFGVISLINMIIGLIIFIINGDKIILQNLVIIPIPVASFCFGHLFWKKNRRNKV